MEKKLSADEFRSLFADLADELAKKGIRGEVHVAGGAAMSLEYRSEALSGDADSQFAPHGPMVEAIRTVADRRGVSRTWLNDQASVYFSPLARPVRTIFTHPNLSVMVTPADHLAAINYPALTDGVCSCPEVWRACALPPWGDGASWAG